MTPTVYRWTKTGNWHTTIVGPGGAKTKRDLGTADRAEALRRAAAAVGERAETTLAVHGGRPAQTAHAPPPAPPPARPGEDKMRALFARDAAAAQRSADVAPPSPSEPTRPASPAEGGATPGGLRPAPSGKVALSDDESKKLAELAASVAVQLNVLMVGGMVRVFGKRKPNTEDVDEDWEAMNHKGWTPLLEKLVGQREASPLGIVLVSSVGMGIGMYAGGTPLPKPAAADRSSSNDSSRSAESDAVGHDPAPLAPIVPREGKWVPPSADDDKSDDDDGSIDLSRYRAQLAESA